MSIISPFYQDDANHDPQWSEEQVLEAKLNIGGVVISRLEYDIMAGTTVAVFEVLERAWAALDCALIDMKIEFGIDALTSEYLGKISLCFSITDNGDEHCFFSTEIRGLSKWFGNKLGRVIVVHYMEIMTGLTMWSNECSI